MVATPRSLQLAGALAVAVLAAGCTSPPVATIDTDVAVGFALDRDFADPDVLEAGDLYYAYATQSADYNVQVATSTDLLEWQYLTTDALPELPAWAQWGDTWAPEVAATDDGYVMYFTTTSREAEAQCIGVATATDPEGPFSAVGDSPLVCPTDEGGAIDAASFVDDDGSRYLLWKNDGNCCGLDTWISIAPLTPDGITLAGEPTRLIQQDQGWEGRLVEAPTLVKHDNRYVLFYSANDYYGLDYAIGYATASAVLGPYEKATDPLLTTDSSDFAYYGPGGQDVVGDLIVFHSWNEDHTYRGLNVAPITWVSGVPTVELPRPVD